MNNEKEEGNIPTIDLKMKTKEVKSGIVYTPYILVETPYMIFSDKDGTRKIWTNDKIKILLYYIYRITNIKWFIKKYNQRAR